MNTRPHPEMLKACRGFVLLAVLVFIFLLSMLTVSLLFRSQGEETATSASLGSEQAWAAAMSGVHVALQSAGSAAPGSTEWQDNPAVFRQQLVYEDGADQWFFTVFTPGGSDDLIEIRHGLSDEASRLNLNHPGESDFGRIPRVTPLMAEAMRNYLGQTKIAAPRSEPGNPTDSAAGLIEEAPVSYPLSAFFPRKLATVDELLAVSGFSWFLLHGEDLNMNGRLDANEDDGDETFPPDNHDGHLDHGMAQYFSVQSSEPDLNNAGLPRININAAPAALPTADLPPAFTNYVAALRASGHPLKHVSEALEASVKAKDDKGAEIDVPSGIGKEELPRLLDLFTADEEAKHEGLININTADAIVLGSIPDIDPALAETIVSTRASLSPERRTTIAWLYQEGLVDAGKFKAIAPNLTARSHQFRFHVVGYGLPSGRYRVLEVGIDVAGSLRQITYLRDITRLGMPFPLKINASNASGDGVTLRKARRTSSRSTHG